MTDLEQMEREMDAELVGIVRDVTKRTTGGNCAYADSDVRLLARLARRAIEAGLIDGFPPRTATNLKQKQEEFAASAIEAASADETAEQSAAGSAEGESAARSEAQGDAQTQGEAA